MTVFRPHEYTDSPADLRELIASFTVEGEPISKARARFTSYGGKVRSYTPEKTLTGEKNIARAFRLVAAQHEPDATHAYAVSATFHNGTRQRRDVDNMVKLILDGLNKIAWADDNQVTEITGRKMLTTSDTARTTIHVWRLGIFERRTSNCTRCGTAFDTFPSQAARKFCTLDCYHEGLREKRKRTCEQCSADFYPNPGGKARFCSVKCKSEAGRREVFCTHCGGAFSKQACFVKETNFCTPKCQQGNMRPKRAESARGKCATCGEATSKKQYTNCQKCAITKVSGAPRPTKVTA